MAPRHRRAPTRRGVASQRHAERDIPDGSFIPRSNSTRATSSANLAKEQQVPTEFKELMQSLRAREEENETYENGTEVMENELKSDTSLEQKYASEKIEIKEVVFDSNEIAESTNRDITNEGVNASRSQVHEFTKLEANTEEDKTSMDSRSDILPVTASENETEVLEKNTQLTAEEVLKERKSSNQDSNNLVEFSVSLPETVVAPVFEIITDPESKLNGERAHDDKPGDDIGIFPEEITELTPDTDPEPSCEVIAEQASVEFLEPDPNIIPESASEPVTDESNEVTSLSGTVSGPVRQKFDNAENVPEQVPPKAESEQITAPSLSSDQERPQPSLTLPNDAIPGGVSGPSQEAFMEAASQPASDHIPGTVSESVLPEFVELKKVPEQVILVTGFEQKTDPSLSSDLESFKLNPTLPNEDINIQESKLIKSSSAKVVATSPARSKRLTIEMPENVFQKPIMQELSTKENSNEEKSDECNEMHERRTQSVGISKVEKIHDGEDSSEDDHTAGVAKLTQVFERSSRAKSFSHAERRKKPDVLPKPKIPAPKPGEEKTWSSTRSRSLGRNYRAPVTAEKSVEKSPETGSGKSEERIIVGRANDTMIIVDPETLEKHKSEVAATTTKKGGKSGKSAPKPLPKPKLRKESKPEVDLKTNRDVSVLNGEGKENLKV